MIAVEAGRFERRERDARLAHQARLDALRRAGEEDLVAVLGEHLGQRERWVDMAGGAAAGKDNAHDDLPP